MDELDVVKACTRVALFETGDTSYPFTSHGGTITLVQYDQDIFALTCQHVLGQFTANRLAIPSDRRGGEAISPTGRFSIYSTIDLATDSDIRDLTAYKLSDKVGTDWFHHKPLSLNELQTKPTERGDELYIYGNVSKHTIFLPEKFEITFAEMNAWDEGSYIHDPILRLGRARHPDLSSNFLDGFSGAPLYNFTKKSFGGIVTRAGTDSSGLISIYYIDGYDVLEFLKGTAHPGTLIRYDKPFHE